MGKAVDRVVAKSVLKGCIDTLADDIIIVSTRTMLSGRDEPTMKAKLEKLILDGQKRALDELVDQAWAEALEKDDEPHD